MTTKRSITEFVKPEPTFPEPVVDNAWPSERTITAAIMDLELGELGVEEEVEVFAYLIRTGLAWALQGSYGRAAQHYIENGIISEEGDIL